MAKDNRQKEISPIFSPICFNFIGEFYLNEILKRNTQKNTLIQAKEHLLREVCFSDTIFTATFYKLILDWLCNISKCMDPLT